uniref:phage tail length tape measure family protein n=1 Tax=Paenirhodobacter enshiensis TaxID=1105367 RepID=UPI003FA27CBE
MAADGSGQFVWSILFRADNTDAKAATRELKKEVTDLNTSTRSSTPDVVDNTAATRRNTDAKRDAARATQEQAEAERKARKEVDRSTGVIPASPSPVMPAPQPQPAGPSDDERAALRARYVPMAAAERQYRDELAQLRKAQGVGAVSDDEAVAAEARLKAGYDRTVESIRRAEAATTGQTGAIKLQAWEQRNLMYQVNDTVQSLAVGMSPMQVMLQQGPQITQLYGGVGRTLRAVGQAMTIGRVAVSGLAAAIAIGATAWNSYLVSTKEVATAAAGAGRTMAGTTAAMEASAHAGAAAAGISISAARSMEATFLRTGKIGAENFGRLIGISQDFAATMGVSSEQAGDALA